MRVIFIFLNVFNNIKNVLLNFFNLKLYFCFYMEINFYLFFYLMQGLPE